MKKTLAMVVAVAALAVNAADSYLYWMTPEANVNGFEWTTARIGVSQGIWPTGSFITSYSDGFGNEIPGYPDEANTGFIANLGQYSGSEFSFWIELLNDTTVVAHSSEGLSYDYLYSQGYIFKESMDPSGGDKAWSVTSFTAGPVPEPTSGILSLFGLALLALRRKKA